MFALYTCGAFPCKRDEWARKTTDGGMDTDSSIITGNIYFQPRHFAVLKWFEDACVSGTGVVRNELIR